MRSADTTRPSRQHALCLHIVTLEQIHLLSAMKPMGDCIGTQRAEMPAASSTQTPGHAYGIGLQAYCFALRRIPVPRFGRQGRILKAGLTAGSSRSAFAERMLRRRLLIWPPVLDAANSAPPAALNITSVLISLQSLPEWTQHACVHIQHELVCQSLSHSRSFQCRSCFSISPQHR